MDISKRKIELEKQLTFYEREKQRSQKLFFVNLFGMIISSIASFFLIPALFGLLFSAMRWSESKGKLGMLLDWSSDDARKAFNNQVRVKSLQQLCVGLILVTFLIGLFWVLFRFRKWTKYSHQVSLIRAELDELEKA